MKLLSSIKNENNCRRKYAEQIKAAICVSEENAQYAYNELGIKDCRVIPNGSDPARFSPDQYNKSLYDNYDDYFKVIYIGDSQYPWQGFQYVKGLAEMARQKGDKFLFIALDNSSSGLTVENDNLLRYKIDYLDVPMYVASADACLCLYAEHEFSIYKYGFNLSPLKLFDYMASGKPVIGTHVGQIKAVIDDGKDGLLTTNNLDDIYEKLLFCFNNQSKAKQMGRLAREKIINNYNWMKIAQTTHDLFASLQ